MPLPTILTTTSEVVDFAAELAGHETIAVDLEADSMHNYQEKVCLLQFTTPQQTILIDPLELPDLDSLKSMFANPDQRKIFHAADYDIRSLGRDFDITVRGLFDTMISCQFLGEERFGLADVLKKYFGVELNKRFQRADWSLRPLSADMIRYAAEDTRYLHDLAQLLEDKLCKRGGSNGSKKNVSCLSRCAFLLSKGPCFYDLKVPVPLSRASWRRWKICWYGAMMKPGAATLPTTRSWGTSRCSNWRGCCQRGATSWKGLTVCHRAWQGVMEVLFCSR